MVPMVESETLNTTRPLPKEGQEERVVPHPFLFVVLHCDQPLLGGARYELSQVDTIAIGRGKVREAVRSDEGSSRTLTLRLPSPTISKVHAHLVRSGEGWMLEDLGSKNGCCINGRRVTRSPVQDGDFIEIGSVMLRYCAAMPVVGKPVLDLDLGGDGVDTTETGFSSLVPALATQLESLTRVARLPFTTLLYGETGTGKEILALGLHKLSGRSGQFVAVNCGALPPTLIESQLFGHLKGSFTGAQRDEQGFVRSAEGGTLFLDEIGDLPLPAQAALLRVLQQREVIPVGATRPTTVDVRFVAATNKSLEELCLRGEFRGDLLARLGTYKHKLPPLRERVEDLGHLIASLLRASTVPRVANPQFAVPAARKLLAYGWPQNIRELEGTLGVAVALAENGFVERFDLQNAVAEAPAREEPLPSPEELRERIVVLLREHQGNATHVARAMGKSRAQIYRWMQEFGINPNDYRT